MANLIDAIPEIWAIELTRISEASLVVGGVQPEMDMHLASWWDAFKERWYPVWAKYLWPVRWREELREPIQVHVGKSLL